MNELLEKTDHFTDNYLGGLRDDYISHCETNKEYPWTYYYIKYKIFRTERYGKYWWDDFDNKPYVFTTIFQQQKASSNSYNPFLKAVNDNVWREYFGNYIYIDEEKCLKETQSSYQVVTNDDEEIVLNEYTISQNGNGIDIENRIEKMKGII